jgi:hypothetical protein
VNYAEAVFGNTLLHFMAYDDLNDAAEMLLTNGAHVSIRNFNEETPLHWAARVGSLKTMEVLVSFHADVNAADVTGGTALHSAAAAGMPDSIPFLLSNGCDWELCDGDGKTALQVARMGSGEGHAAVKYIIEKSMKVNGNHYVPVGSQEPPSRRPGRECPGMETQVDHGMLHSSASEMGIVTRLDVVSHLDEPTGMGTDVDGMGHTMRATNMLGSGPPGSPTTRQLSVSMGAVRSSSEASLFIRSPNKKKNILAFWTSSGRSNLGALPAAPEPVVIKPQPKPDPSAFFLPADFVPFAPRAAERLDIFIGVEQCADCHLHSMSLWHDAHKYTSAGDTMLRAAVTAVYKQGYPCRVFAYKAKPTRSRLGALELTVSLRVAQKGTVDKLRNMVLSGGTVIKHDPRNKGWFSHCAYSKLTTTKWPQPDQAGRQVVDFLDQAFVDAGEAVVKTRSALGAAQAEQVQAWSQRLYRKALPGLEAADIKKVAPVVPTVTDNDDDSTSAMLRAAQATAAAAAIIASNERARKAELGPEHDPAQAEVPFLATISEDDPARDSYEAQALEHFFCFNGALKSSKGGRR